ncbi:5791_t:CDS:2 [Cetraspora pellucida]|uniref:5791_t:CDS:1 n=1 Tax=Cetraspora pellucida TaxID=1433469 RepID=A0A9N8ZIE2_9GLOM|nr:5791_t:CDS:2 [Cetraspora pellucida]
MASEVLSSIHTNYLVPFALHVNATALRSKTLAPFFKGATVNTILLMTASFYVSPRQNEPPMVPYWIPFIGSAVTMGIDPIKFYRDKQKEYGNYYTYILFGRRMVTCLGADGNNLVFNAKLADASAEEAYKSLTVPVFGTAGLSLENLRAYVPMIEMETKNYLSRWNKKSDIQDVHKAMAELIILTASRCLLGDEVRSKVDESCKY